MSLTPNCRREFQVVNPKVRSQPLLHKIYHFTRKTCKYQVQIFSVPLLPRTPPGQRYAQGARFSMVWHLNVTLVCSSTGMWPGALGKAEVLISTLQSWTHGCQQQQLFCPLPKLTPYHTPGYTTASCLAVNKFERNRKVVIFFTWIFFPNKSIKNLFLFLFCKWQTIYAALQLYKPFSSDCLVLPKNIIEKNDLIHPFCISKLFISSLRIRHFFCSYAKMFCFFPLDVCFDFSSLISQLLCISEFLIKMVIYKGIFWGS